MARCRGIDQFDDGHGKTQKSRCGRAKRKDLRARCRDANVELVPRPPVSHRIASTKALVLAELVTKTEETEHAKY